MESVRGGVKVGVQVGGQGLGSRLWGQGQVMIGGHKVGVKVGVKVVVKVGGQGQGSRLWGQGQGHDQRSQGRG